MRARALLRVFLVYLIVMAIFFYNVGDLFSLKRNDKAKTAETKMLFVGFDSGVLEEGQAAQTEAEATTKATENTASTAKTEQVSASAVKGKIESRYISPYTASLSYNNVYIKNSTSLKINIKEMLEASLGFKIENNSEPQVLIMHTHTTESYVSDDKEYYTEDYTSRNTDNTKNMAKIGEIVAEKLNAAGIKTLHDKTQHDYPQYSGSYTRSAKTVNSYLKKYPSIKIVLDLHRDAISAGGSDKVKLVTEIGGKKAAQVMLVMGSNSGTTTNHPKWQENLKLALKLQQTLEVKYPTLARPLSLMPKNYNQSLSTGSLLIEFGTDANSLAEAMYSAEMVGESLATLIKNLS